MAPESPTPTDDEPTDEPSAAADIATLLTNPDAFFRRRADDTALRGPVTIVLLVAVIGLVGSVPVLNATTAAMPAEMGLLVPVIAAASIVGGILGTLVTWVLYAGAFYVISTVAFDAPGSFRTTLALTGWGFVPRVPQAAIGSTVSYLVFADARLPSDPRQLEATIRALQNDPLFVVTGISGIVFLAWSAMLWTFAMRHGRSLTLRRAALSVAGPVALALLFELFGPLGVL